MRGGNLLLVAKESNVGNKKKIKKGGLTEWPAAVEVI